LERKIDQPGLVFEADVKKQQKRPEPKDTTKTRSLGKMQIASPSVAHMRSAGPQPLDHRTPVRRPVPGKGGITLIYIFPEKSSTIHNVQLAYVALSLRQIRARNWAFHWFNPLFQSLEICVLLRANMCRRVIHLNHLCHNRRLLCKQYRRQLLQTCLHDFDRNVFLTIVIHSNEDLGETVCWVSACTMLMEDFAHPVLPNTHWNLFEVTK
jgi:hypothetical protein